MKMAMKWSGALALAALISLPLQPVFASLDEKTLQQLNARIAVEGQDAKRVAADYLQQKGLLK